MLGGRVAICGSFPDAAERGLGTDAFPKHRGLGSLDDARQPYDSAVAEQVLRRLGMPIMTTPVVMHGVGGVA